MGLAKYASAPTLLLMAVALPACGSSGASDEEVQRERGEAAQIARQEERLKQLERELKERRSGNSGSPSAPSGPAPPSSGGGPPGTSHCGGGLYVNSVTTCPFAENVRSAYRASGGASRVEAHSPATGSTYVMSCTSGSPHICTGGNDATIYFP